MNFPYRGLLGFSSTSKNPRTSVRYVYVLCCPPDEPVAPPELQHGAVPFGFSTFAIGPAVEARGLPLNFTPVAPESGPRLFFDTTCQYRNAATMSASLGTPLIVISRAAMPGMPGTTAPALLT
ncbi:MAG: hypothetical protein DMF94_27465 [Acidobacteria bacterium]|nr:MAG: hypothetical protein DMF94_27465 [Acidobacteriota bacterium]